MFDRKEAEQAFTDYTSGYDLDNTMIRLKAEHTIKVAQIAERIAVSIGVKDDEIDPALPKFYTYELDIKHSNT